MNMIKEINDKDLPTKDRICIFRDTQTIMLEAMFTHLINEWNRTATGFSIMNANFFNKINDYIDS